MNLDDKKFLEQVKSFLAERKILVVDTSKTARATIGQGLINLGASEKNMTFVRTFDAVSTELAQEKHENARGFGGVCEGMTIV